jgi:hypothetical protein
MKSWLNDSGRLSVVVCQMAKFAGESLTVFTYHGTAKERQELRADYE